MISNRCFTAAGVLAANLLLAAGALAQAPAQSPAPAAPAKGAATTVKVNGVTIPQARIDMVMKTMAAQGQSPTPDMRKIVVEELITREVLTQAAVKKGLDKNPDVQAQMDMARQGILINSYLQDHMKSNPVTEAAVKAEYERIKAQLGQKEYKARHILVKNEAEAKDLIAQLKKGAKFEDLAAEKSDDVGSKTRGGELDWSPAAAFDKGFGDALAKLKKGETTQTPVHSQYGWHVIRLDDERAPKPQTYDELKPRIQQQMQQAAVSKLITELRGKARIE